MNNHQDMPEWVTLAPGISVIIRTEGRFSVYKARDFAFSPAFAQNQLASSGTPETTRALLSGALVAGLGRPDPRHTVPPMSLPQVIHRLCGRYQTTHATPLVFQEVAERLRAQNRWPLADFIARKACEETGHDRLVIKDLTALGLPAERLVESIRPPTALALVTHLQELADGSHPVGVLGYAYALERAALFVGQAQIDATQAVCPQGVDATRGMRTHSAVGSDRAHVMALVEFIAALPAAERAIIAQAAYHTARHTSRKYPGEPPSDAAIVERLQGLGVAWPLAA
jgi:hypothetical protein